ncbi:MAG: GTP-binding protein [Gordonia sp. (in: high G+C Gram-positive bacteria)]|uniref:ribosome hibernation factor-recruiting GTPase MRF n=1 Tax=Gordonia sp. (in: high G+C Gram-positive bacteria) TaxID=84139 RepID=UPI003BB5D801
MPIESDTTPVTLVAGLSREAIARVAGTLALPGTALIAHDLRALPLGYVIRQTRTVREGAEDFAIDGVPLDHGCATCTLRRDLLPMLRRLHRTPGVERIVVALDPAFEPESVAVEMAGTIVEDDDLPAGTASDDVTLRATIVAIDEETWLRDATGDRTLHEADLATVEDERTLAQLAVAQVRFGDLLVIEGSVENDHYRAAQLSAVLRRINPAAMQQAVGPRQSVTIDQLIVSLAALRPESRRGRPTTPFDPLLDGCPPLVGDCGIEMVVFEADRPFHPERLHDALDALLDGVVCSRGRLWLTSSPDHLLWLESAGEALGVSRGGRWLAARTDAESAGIDPIARAMAAARWDDEHGDRHSSIVAVTHHADTADIEDALTAALVTDDEIARGAAYLASLPSPFGDVHQDPCEDSTVAARDITAEETTR